MKFLIRCIGILAVLSMIFLSGCMESETENKHLPSDATQNHVEIKEEDTTAKTIEIMVNGQKFEISCCDNETASAFINALPLTLDMRELNGNEKYHYLDKPLPSAPSRVESISCGDLMLYGSDCIVLFYKNFSTSYSYTKIGKIIHTEGLARVLGKEAVTITFQITGE